MVSRKSGWYKKFVISMLMIMSAICFIPLSVNAEGSITLHVTCTYGQTQARAMLDMVNEFRKSSPTCWNSTDTEQVAYTGLSDFTYDYDLEEIAMKRAVEAALLWDGKHTRPNGEDCFSAFNEAGYSCNYGAENIAYNWSSDPKDAFTQWKEETKKYAGQGHRRNMLSSDCTAIGIGHVEVNGYHYWVQEFANPSRNTTATIVNDSETVVDIEAISTYGTVKIDAYSEEDGLKVQKNDSIALPEVKGSFETNGAQIDDTYPCDIDSSYYTISIEDTDIAKIESDKIFGLKAGTTNIIIKNDQYEQDDVIIPIEVTKISLKDAELDLQDIYNSIYGKYVMTYTSKALEPEVSVSINNGLISQELNASDYTVSYKDNIDVGTATVTVTASEDSDYMDSVTQTFEIEPAPLNKDYFKVTIGDEQYVYNGAEIKPDSVVSAIIDGEDINLTEDVDYTLDYIDNLNVGPATIEVTGIGNYTGTYEKTFDIIPLSLEDTEITIEPESIDYTGSVIDIPQFNIIIPETEIQLKEEVDYSITPDYSGDIVDAGQYKYIIKAISDNLTGSTVESFTVNSIELTADNTVISLVGPESYEYTGESITPSVTVSFIEDEESESQGKTLQLYTDFEVTYSNNINAGTAVATVSGNGNYKGSVEIEYTITPIKVDLSGCSLVYEDDKFVYTGAPIELDITDIVDSNNESMGFVKDKDYEVIYENNINAGTATVTAALTGNNEGTLTKEFVIAPKSISDIDDPVTADISEEANYSGDNTKPVINLIWNDNTLVENVDYEVSSSPVNNEEIFGKYNYVITGKGNYTGSLLGSFTVTRYEITDKDVTIIYKDGYDRLDYTGDEFIYGEDFTVEVTGIDGAVLEEGKDYSINVPNNIIDSDEYEIVVSVDENNELYCGSVTKILKVQGVDLSDAVINISDENIVYNGNAKRPEDISVSIEVDDEIVTLEADKDYSLEITDNINAGLAMITVNGKGLYEGKVTKTFEIKPYDLKDAVITLENEELNYTGAELDVPKVHVIIEDSEYELIEGTDYTVVIEDVIRDADEYSLNIESLEDNMNVIGSVENVTFTVTPATLNEDNTVITFDEEEDYFIYNGEIKKPEVEVTLIIDGEEDDIVLIKDQDYIVMYDEEEDFINAGKKNVTIKGTGNYTGEITKEYEIAPIKVDLSDYDFSYAEEDYIYTGKEITVRDIEITDQNGDLVEWVEDEDYEILYDNNIDAGEASVKVSLIGNYSGTIEKTYIIMPRNLEDDLVSAAISDNAGYNGTDTKPVINIYMGEYLLEENKDYTVTTESIFGEKLGSYTYMVSGTGNFIGSITGEFVVTKRELTDEDIEIIPVNGSEGITYTGEELILGSDYNIIVHGSDDEILVEGDDYDLELPDSIILPGEYDIIVTINDDCELYSGKVTKKLVVMGYDLSGYEIRISDDSFVYNGEAVRPDTIELVSKEDSSVLDADNYTITISDNVNVGIATITATGNGKYEGSSIDTTFEIIKLNLDSTNDGYSIASIPDQKYTGERITPQVRIMKDNSILNLKAEDYEIVYQYNIEVGTATVTVTGKGTNVEGSIVGTFEIVTGDNNGDNDGGNGGDNGGNDGDNGGNGGNNGGNGDNNGGNNGDGNGGDNDGGSYAVKTSINSAIITTEQSNYTYTGASIEPSIYVTLNGTGLVKDRDYTVRYYNNINIGTATIIIAGIGNYEGSASATFTIIKASDSANANPVIIPVTPATPLSPVTNTNGTVTDTQVPGNSTALPAVGDSFIVSNGIYVIMSNDEVSFEPANNNLSKITIPANVTIGGISYKVTSIKANAFKGNTKLKQITIGKNIKKIGAKAFYGCKNLQLITIKSKKLKSSTVGSNAFKKAGSKKYSKLKVKVPKSKKKLYKLLLVKKGLSKKAKIK